MDTNDIQSLFFKHVKAALPANISLADDVAEALNISADSAYRRIRGEKALTFDEIKTLSIRYHISLDQVMHIDSDSTIFHGRNLDNEQFDFGYYLGEILAGLQQINAAKERKMYYEAKDIPIFYHFQFPELAAFKYFFWMKSVMYYPSYSRMQFEDNELLAVFGKTGRQIIELYSKVPSAEIWIAESVNATLRQIEYYHDAGVFRKKETIAMLYDQLTTLINHIKEQAECGEKFLVGDKPNGKGGAYELYYNEVFLGHNTIVVETDGIQTAYLNHAVMNFMRTHDAGFCNYTKRSVANNMKKSVLISTVGEKERNRFFNGLMGNIVASRSKVLG
jgi:hypothetical protein